MVACFLVVDRINQKGMACMPTRRSPVSQRRLPVKIVVPTVQTTPPSDGAQCNDESKSEPLNAKR
jgi:hypothetical protein